MKIKRSDWLLKNHSLIYTISLDLSLCDSFRTFHHFVHLSYEIYVCAMKYMSWIGPRVIQNILDQNMRRA